MANCPKCNYKLSLIDLKAECPVCGVNLVYYGMEERLNKEADKAEYEHAKTQPYFDRLKAATIGSTVSKIRIAICLLPLLAMLLPLGNVAITLPYTVNNITVNLIEIVNIFSNLDTDFIFNMIGSQTVGTAYICYAVALVFIAIAALAALLNLIFLTMACGKKGIQRNIATASIGIVATIVAAVCFMIYCSTLGKFTPDIFTGSLSWGGAVVILAFVAEIVINVVYKKKGIQVKYTDVSKYLIAYEDRDHSDEEPAVAAETTIVLD